MPKRDHYDDPGAPAANSIVVAVSAFVQDERGRVLMIRRTDNDEYAIPGGAQEIGETVADAAVRETFEETGIEIEVVGLVGVYSDPGHVIAYDDGEVRQEFSLCFRARPVGGSLRESSESSEVHWVRSTGLPALNIGRANRLRIEHGLRGDAAPHLG
ncbi:NUDIX domain-containing protein [Saccharopolyspora sp. TS4A08]|uniref:NUDIX domain-containing protein n=1 Tax=Saccharopolyspora ipomoeae TaxID=3042027 RepID=A0ABT6PWP6_9PSEU|nr:NUDIX domain-containing protein [Saccharopolyspora sp. TS4A08]MDI2032444.1 NUDIX domain-containing protein [Saccharopolyspora sp. TS4A08]